MVGGGGTGTAMRGRGREGEGGELGMRWRVIDECVRLRIFLRHLGGTVLFWYQYRYGYGNGYWSRLITGWGVHGVYFTVSLLLVAAHAGWLIGLSLFEDARTGGWKRERRVVYVLCTFSRVYSRTVPSSILWLCSTKPSSSFPNTAAFAL